MLIFLLFISGCSENCLSKKEKEVTELLHSNFSIGDSFEEVKSSINNIDISFSYNEYVNRFNTTVRGCGKYGAISVLIIFDDENKLSEIKVFKSYTMP